MKTISTKSDHPSLRFGAAGKWSRHASRVTFTAPKQSEGGRAFTVVELLVVIAIIGILAALLLPVLAKAKVAAQKSQAKVEISQIVGAIQKYDSDYGRFPIWVEAQGLVGTNDITVGGTNYAPDGTVSWIMGVTNNAGVIAILMDATNYPNGNPTPNPNHVKNPQRTVFLGAKMSGYDPALPATQPPGGVDLNGDYRDPWGSPYIITMDLNYDEQCRDSNYCLHAVSQIQAGKPQGWNGLYNPDANPDSDNFLYHGKVMVWSAGPDRKFDLNLANVPEGKANAGVNKDNILSWQ